MNNNNKYFLSLNLIFLILSVMFIFPMQFGNVNAEVITNEQAEQTCGPPTNVKDSFVLSAISFCIPGILENLDKKRQIECERVVCKYTSIKNGLPEKLCNEQAELKTCRFWLGEFFAVPPMSIISYYTDAIKEIITNPVGIAFSYTVKTVREAINAACPGVVSCNSGFIAGMTVIYVIDANAAYQRINALFENGFTGNQRVNYCSQVNDIKEELEDIVEAYDALEGFSEDDEESDEEEE